MEFRPWPHEPPVSLWHLPSADQANAHGIVGVGADLEPGTLLAAYRSALFPMPVESNGPIGWWSPDPRGVFELDEMHTSRSLRRSMRNFNFTVNDHFSAVMERCADSNRPGGWITDEIQEAYLKLHRLGWAHSIEVHVAGRLVGGLYGVNVGGIFAGESMFHDVTDASKAALIGLRDVLNDGEPRLIDTQWLTPHLASLGASEMSRASYLARLVELSQIAPPKAFEPPRPAIEAAGEQRAQVLADGADRERE